MNSVKAALAPTPQERHPEAELNPSGGGQGAASVRANRTHVHRRSLRDLLRIDSKRDFHDYGIRHAIERYRVLRGEQGLELGSVLSIGSTCREARNFVEHPFDEICLTGILDPDDELRQIAAEDSRVRYEKQNCERLSYPSASFDLVFCKEALHHLARPVQGLYELLRVCRVAVLVLEPYDSQLDGLLRRLGLNTVYESNQLGNLELRDNFVYRWDRRELEYALKSLYLESGSSLELTLGWLSSRYNGHPNRAVRRVSAVAGWLLGFAPGSRGNFMTALIAPGRDLPPDPEPY